MSYSGPETSFMGVAVAFFRLDSGELRRVTVDSIQPHKAGFLMRVEELGTAEEAEVFRDAEILVYKEALAREAGSYFWHELLGLDVFTDMGVFLGTLSQIIPTAGHDIYVVKNGEKEVYIPATIEVIREIDPGQGRMTISPTEGLLDLNEI
jgi:16S rRNA processing protein RimM